MRQNISDQKYKTSFAPISDQHSKILILGSLPGEKSLEIQEYYGHPRNKFWNIISLITDSSATINYPEKRNLLLLHHIALWDIVQQATRNGSLDNAIKNVLPNDLALFIQQHPLLKIIAFNGQKSQQLYDAHFERYPHLTYVTLPSTSPANASQKKEVIFSKWLILKEYL